MVAGQIRPTSTLGSQRRCLSRASTPHHNLSGTFPRAYRGPLFYKFLCGSHHDSSCGSEMASSEAGRPEILHKSRIEAIFPHIPAFMSGTQCNLTKLDGTFHRSHCRTIVPKAALSSCQNSWRRRFLKVAHRAAWPMDSLAAILSLAR